MNHKITYTMLLLLLFNCAKAQKPETVAEVDINKYMGKWYEIASFPNSFQKGCHCTTAEYELVPGAGVKVINTCRKDSINGKISRIQGRAFVVKGSGNAKLKVQFFWPFRGDYWIFDLAPDYSYAVVGHPNRKYLWILSRTAKMDDITFSGIVGRIAGKGFDINKLKMTVQ